MNDVLTVVMALAAAAGAWAARPVPLWLGLVLAAIAFARRRPVLLVIAVGLMASTMSARSWAGLRPPAPRAVVDVMTLLTDPEPVAGAIRVEARVGHRHAELWARGASAGALYHRLAGERVEIGGRLRPLSPAMRMRLGRRHIAAQIDVERVGRVWPGSLPVRYANLLRRTLERGAEQLPSVQRSLFAGFVLGDDRGQPEEVTDEFRRSGLSHLLVVSGENVAFVLALVAPLLHRVGLRMRLVLGVLVLLGFGLVIRWEPSVLRAEAMAAIAMTATALGRPVSSIRVLALAVTALLLVDPMLVRSVGFLLSVGACTGIALLAAPIARRLPGPRPLASAMGVTMAAQMGVAPILIPVFGPLPLATVPANLLAIPAAGPIMVWGMTAGVAAGLVPAPVARLLHVPTRLLIAWVAGVARVGARLPLGHVGLVPLVVVALAVVAARTARLRSARAVEHR
ncbi:MAG TPA: ComEC/Rec2 family competence protein [Acidimicrobiales bacterium]|nr:ComEC/Rec2 family competence protein [Acidimicrobiales bacterium]